jgi:hypothetical protein
LQHQRFAKPNASLTCRVDRPAEFELHDVPAPGSWRVWFGDKPYADFWQIPQSTA